MSKLSMGFATFAVVMGALLGGCAVQNDDGTIDDENVDSVESAEKRAPTRSQRIAACKEDCAAEHTPCRDTGFSAYSFKDVKSKCNSKLSPELGGNPFALAICKDACDKL